MSLRQYLIEERLSVMAQVKITPSESARIDQAVIELNAEGIKSTRSSFIRACVRRGLAIYGKDAR